MKKGTFLILTITSFLILVIICLFIPLRQALVIQPRDPALRPAYIPLKDEAYFKIKYTHSIHLTDVVESYKILPDGKIQQYELMYKNFAIGMPSDAENGERFVQKNGMYYIKNMKRIFSSFYIRIGQVRANHRLIYHKKEYTLAQIFKPGASVKVEVRKLSLVQQMKGVNILESF
ncbi:DUF1850 domain-containing protein [Neobacillus mesonae]|uniref:DUF1850 domain-containing protein n=1 Tax=Neobacillus mesonae TaxID=1193713 RepID=UPI00203DAB20|nr:DUF1850 domain-containing protein [Neobacillus mesonae]MCM3567651.1 DUF1850 domain-containing protein [Neobacillus mesonae]